MPFVVVTSDLHWGIAPTEDVALLHALSAGAHRSSDRYVVELNDSVPVDSVRVNVMGDVYWDAGDRDAVVNRWLVEGGKRRQLSEKE